MPDDAAATANRHSGPKRSSPFSSVLLSALIVLSAALVAYWLVPIPLFRPAPQPPENRPGENPPGPEQRTPVAKPASDDAVGQRAPLTAEQCTQVRRLVTEILGLLENEAVAEAEPRLTELEAIVPRDPFVIRNRAIARLMGLAAGKTSLDAARSAAESLAASEPNDPWAQIVRGRIWAGIAEKETLPETREQALATSASAMQTAVTALPQHWLPPYELFTVTRYAADPKWTAIGQQALDQAYQRSPRNLFLLCDWLLSQAERKSPQLADGLQAARQTLAPVRAGILKRTRIDVDQFLQQALDSIAMQKWEQVLPKVRVLTTVVRPDERAQSDRRQLSPNPLEFLLPNVRAELCPDDASGQSGPPASPLAKLELQASAGSLPGITQARAIQITDFDLDQQPDLIVLEQGRLSVHRRKSSDSAWELLVELPIDADLQQLRVLDLDRDTTATPTAAAQEAAPQPVPAPNANPADAKADPAKTAEAGSQVCQEADPDVLLFGPGGVRVLTNLLGEPGPAGEQATRKLIPIEQTEGLEKLREITAGELGDFDHDGDLDFLFATPAGLTIWSARGDGQYEEITARSQLPPLPRTVTQMRSVDWDRDVDLDVVLGGPDLKGLFLLENLRHGEFMIRPLIDEANLVPAADAIEVLEADGNVSWDLAVRGEHGLQLLLTSTVSRGRVRFLKSHRVPLEAAASGSSQLQAADLNHDGWQDLIVSEPQRTRLYAGQPEGRLDLKPQVLEAVSAAPAAAEPDSPPPAGSNGTASASVAADLDGDGDLDLALISAGRIQFWTNSLPAGNHWLTVRVRGENDAQSGRVNQHNVGGLVELRTGSHYQAQVIRGQATDFGLGTATYADAVRVLFTNGIPQVKLQPQGNTAICERQILKGSCPYLYTWTGERFAFYTDLLWAAPLGLQFGDGILAPARPWEYLKISGSRLQANSGRYRLRITEELWEAAYFDQVELIAVDHPAEIEIYSNEKVGPPSVTEHRIHQVQTARRISPQAAVNHRGRDLLPELLAADGNYAQPFDIELRQGLVEPHWIELDLNDRREELQAAKKIMLYLTGWIYPTDTALNLAIEQDRRLSPPRPPSLLVPDQKGDWTVAREQMGFPGGKTKTIAIDLTGLFPAQDYRLRIATSQELRWDEAFFVLDPPDEPLRPQILNLSAARLRSRGFSEPIPGQKGAPVGYDYEHVVTRPQWPPMGGRFTRYGDVSDLLRQTDDLLVVLGAGDEIELEFEAPAGELPAGWVREFLIHNVGWDKDADLHTVYGQDSTPLPYQAMSFYPLGALDRLPDHDPQREAAYQRYLREYQTREQDWSAYWKLPVQPPATR